MTVIMGLWISAARFPHPSNFAKHTSACTQPLPLTYHRNVWVVCVLYLHSTATLGGTVLPQPAIWFVSSPSPFDYWIGNRFLTFIILLRSTYSKRILNGLVERCTALLLQLDEVPCGKKTCWAISFTPSLSISRPARALNARGGSAV